MRDEKGHFLPGNPGGPGRPPRAVESDYLRILAETVTVDYWKQICERARDNALTGDAKARQWLSEHLLPKHNRLAGAYADVELHRDAVQEEINRRGSMQGLLEEYFQ